MASDLLRTKLFMPRLRPSLVPRPRLIEKLNRGLHHKLTLVSAPAGFGKTTLVSKWIADGVRPFAWLSLDERDSDLNRFFAYVIAALQTVSPQLGSQASGMLKSSQALPAEAILTTLLNEIAAFPEAFVLVLDDYHVVDAQPVDQAITFILEYLPPQMHLVITTREDPLLPLPRLRARGFLTELRVADLRFTLEETAVFLNKVTGLSFSANEIAALERRTEGWIAGLQLAALSMQGRDDVHGFIKTFAGDDRYIVDYLVNEVLQRQPEQIRRFLLQTSILDRLSGPLCSAVTTQAEGGMLLETVERNNLFVIPLDDKRHWYRYHHLFGDVLQAYLLKAQPEGIVALHQRASNWYEENDLMADAVHHAFAAGDLVRAARIVELAWAEMDRNRQAPEWLRWAKKLPEELIHARPVLGVALGWASLDTGDIEAAERWLEIAERALRTMTDPVVADDEEFRYLPGNIASARTYHALALGDMSATIQYARQALDFFPAEAYLRRGTPAALLGLASWASGDLAEAIRAFSEAMTDYQKAGNILYVITGAYVLADMNVAQGRLRAARTIYDESIRLAEAHGEPVLHGAADLYTGMSMLSLEKNDLQAAQEYLLQSKTLGEGAALPRWSYRWYLAQAGIKAAEGNLDGALAALDEAERQYVRGPVPNIRATAAMKARIWVAQGRVHDAQLWADQQNLTSDDALSYLREFDHFTLARILIARYRHNRDEGALQEAEALLARLLEAAEAGGRTGSVLESLIQQALIYAAQRNTPAALRPLARALTLAEPEGYVRIFLDEGRPLAALLKEIETKDERQKAYVSRLLADFEIGEAVPPSAVSPQSLVEPLSERELEVLQLVAEGLSNREIAGRLFIALSTVKGHNRVIYSKLNVSRRTEAVARAQALGLL